MRNSAFNKETATFTNVYILIKAAYQESSMLGSSKPKYLKELCLQEAGVKLG